MLRHESVFILILFLVTLVDAGNVLHLVTPMFSHLHRNVNIAAELAKHHGHKSTFVVDPILYPKLPKKPYIDFIVSDTYLNFNIKAVGEKLFPYMCTSKANDGRKRFMTEEVQSFCKALTSDQELIEALRQKSFDVALVDSNILSGCFSIFAHNLSLPRVQIGIPLHFVHQRIPFMPSVTLPIFLVDTVGEVSFMQRLKNTLVSITIAVHGDAFTPIDIDTYVKSIPFKTANELHATNELILTDTDSILDFPSPTMPNVIQVGGLTTRKPEPLTDPLLSFMDSSPDGVIVVAFGGTGWPLSAKITETFISAFKRMPNIKFVFKYEDSSIKYDENIMFIPWIPQNDLLAHSNTRAFITHCGNNGQYEALYNAVPMLGVPGAGDQFHNAKRMRAKGFGLIIDRCNVDEGTLFNAVNEILKEKYKTAISKASAIYHSLPMGSGQRAAFWIDHVIQHGGKYMQPAYLPFYQYYLLDVILVLLLVGLFCLILFTLMCAKCYGMLTSLKTKQD